MKSSVADVLDGGWERCWEPPEVDVADPISAITEIARSGFAGLCVPAEFRGGGATLLQAATAQRDLALIDAGLAVGMNMHSFTMGLMKEYWIQERDVSWFLLEGIAESNSLVASAFAEPGGTPNMLSANSRATTIPKGFEISGSKFPCSLATTASLLCVNALVEDEDRVIIAVIPAASDGVTVTSGWESQGMRSSDTGRIDLDRVAVDERLVFYTAPADRIDRLVVAGLIWFIVLLGASYHGAISRLLAAVSRTTDCGAVERQMPLGDVLGRLLTLGQSCQGLAHGWMTDRLDEHAALAGALAVRRSITSTCHAARAAVASVAGGRVFSCTDELGRIVLDLAAADHHPPGLLTCQLSLGGLFDDDELTLQPHRRPKEEKKCRE